MKCLIVEDDSMARTSLEILCEKVGDLNAETALNAVEALKMLRENSYDLLFLDVEMPEMSGLELIEAAKELPPIIITSGKREYAFMAFELDVVDYIEKPVTLPRLLKAVEKVRKHDLPTPSDQRQSVFVRSEGKHVRILIDDILFVESIGDYLKFHLSESKHIVYGTLKSIEERLSADPRFAKVHRSYIVNMDHIDDVDEKSVVVKKHVIPISRSNRSEFIAKLNML